MSFSEDVASQQNEAEMIPEAPRNFLSPDDQSGNSDVLCFCFVEGGIPKNLISCPRCSVFTYLLHFPNPSTLLSFTAI